MTKEQKEIMEFFIQSYKDYCARNSFVIIKKKINKEYNRFAQWANSMAVEYSHSPYFRGNNNEVERNN